MHGCPAERTCIYFTWVYNPPPPNPAHAACSYSSVTSSCIELLHSPLATIFPAKLFPNSWELSPSMECVCVWVVYILYLLSSWLRGAHEHLDPIFKLAIAPSCQLQHSCRWSVLYLTLSCIFWVIAAYIPGCLNVIHTKLITDSGSQLNASKWNPLATILARHWRTQSLGWRWPPRLAA